MLVQSVNVHRLRPKDKLKRELVGRAGCFVAARQFFLFNGAGSAIMFTSGMSSAQIGL